MQLSTGISQLDRRLSEIGRDDEGLPAGSNVVVQSPPDAQCDSLIAGGIDQRETVYFTTVRSEAAICESLERVADDPKIGRMVDIDVDNPVEEVIETLVDRLVETDSIALLHGIDDNHTPEFRRYTLEAAHFVWNIAPVEHRASRKYRYYLSIPKARGIELDRDDRLLEVDLGDDFYIDETYNV